MLFLEPWFWTFAAAAVVGFLLLPQALRTWWLLASSVIFYLHFGGVGGVLVVTILATLCWGAGLTSTRIGRWSLPAFAISVCVATLVAYKYANLLRDTLVRVALWTGTTPPVPLLNWMGPVAPLGISFFTFEFVHYYEVRVTGREPVRNPLHFAVFGFFFPTLAAGPIKRFPDACGRSERCHGPWSARLARMASGARPAGSTSRHRPRCPRCRRTTARRHWPTRRRIAPGGPGTSWPTWRSCNARAASTWWWRIGR